MRSVRAWVLALAMAVAASGDVRYCDVRVTISTFDLLVTIPLLSGTGAILSSLGFHAAGDALQQKASDIILVSICQDGVSQPPSHPQVSDHQLSPRAVSQSRLAYVTDSGVNSVRVLDLNAGATRATIQLPGGGAPVGIAITPDGKFLWVCEGLVPETPNATEIEIIDTSSLQIVGSIPLGSLVAVTYIAMTPDGKTAYVTNFGQEHLALPGAVNSILIIDVATRKVTGQILPPLVNPQRPDFGSPAFHRLAVSPDGTLLYAVTGSGIFVYDTLTNTQIVPPPSALAIVNIPTFNVPGANPRQDTRIVFHPSGARVYYFAGCPAPNGGDACLAVLDTKTNLLIDSIRLGPGQTTEPTGIGISADGNLIYVKEFNSGDIIVVDTVAGAVKSHLSGHAQADGIFFDAPLQ